VNPTDCLDTVRGFCNFPVCSCRNGNTYSSITRKCQAPSNNQWNCDTVNDCSDPNAACVSGKCSCKANYKYVASASKCLPGNDNTAACSTITDCADSSSFALCSSGKCTCAAWSSWDTTKFHCKYPNDNLNLCTSINECADNSVRGVCNSYCTCNLGIYDAVSHKCKSANTGGACTDINDCVDNSVHGECKSSKCVCITGYQFVYNAKICKANNDGTIVGSCTGSDTSTCYLSDSKAACISGKCSCAAPYVWYNPTSVCKLTGITVLTVLKSDWTHVNIDFSSNVIAPSGVPLQSAALCNNLFVDETVQLFGDDGYYCDIEGDEIDIYVGNNAKLNPNSVLKIRNGLRFQSYANAYYSPIIINNVESAKVSFKSTLSTSMVQACDYAKIAISSETGIGKRINMASYNYKIIEARSTDQKNLRDDAFLQNMKNLNQLLQNLNKPICEIHGTNFLENGYYKIESTLKTFLGSSMNTLEFNTGPFVKPSLGLAGKESNFYVINEWEELGIVPELRIGGCSIQSFERYNFNWTQKIEPKINLIDEIRFRRYVNYRTAIITFPPNSLLPDSMHSLFLNVTHKDYPDVFYNLTVYIKVQSPRIVATILDGDRTINVNDELILSAIVREECIFYLLILIAVLIKDPVVFNWKCQNITNQNSECFDSYGKLLNSTYSSSTIKFPPATFNQDSSMKWTLTSCKGTFCHTRFVFVNVTNQTKVLVGIRTSKEGMIVNRNNMAIFSVLAYSKYPFDLKYSWISDPVLPAEAYASTLTDKYLKIKPYSLDENTGYTFTCTVTDTDGTQGDSIIKVTVNKSPRDGKLSVTYVPSETNVLPKYELKAEGWSDDNIPLTYLFSLVNPDTGAESRLSPRSEESTIFVNLASKTYEATIKLEVFDSLNASSILYQKITIPQFNFSASDVLKLATDSSRPESERLLTLSQGAKSLNCEIEKQSCGDAILILDQLDRNMSDHSSDYDNAILGILDTVNLAKSDSKLENVMEILARIGYREYQNLHKSLSIADDQLGDKQMQFGLTQNDTNVLASVFGRTIHQMDKQQVLRQQDNIVNTIDIVSRSLIKDAVPGEKPVEIKTNAFSVRAQKVTNCGGNIPYSELTNAEFMNTRFSIPICDILPKQQTDTYTNKVANSYNPYDVIVQVFDKNVIGDCASLPTKLMRVDVFNDYTKIKHSVTNIKKGLNFTFELNSNEQASSSDEFQCVYYERNATGIIPVYLPTQIDPNNNKKFVCTSTHLTEFTLIRVEKPFSFEFFNNEYYVLGALIILNIFMHILVIFADDKTRVDREQIINEKIAKINPQNVPTKQPEVILKYGSSLQPNSYTPNNNDATIIPMEEYHNTSLNSGSKQIYKSSNHPIIDESLPSQLQQTSKPISKLYVRELSIANVLNIFLVF